MRLWLWVVLVAATAFAALSGLAVGALPMSLGEVVGGLGEWLGVVGHGTTDPLHLRVLGEVRAPRVLTALAMGAVLGSSGATMQGLFRNPLADPSLLGVSLGAALGAAITIVVVQPAHANWVTPAGAFAGGLIAATISVAVARRGGGLDTPTLLLGGIAVQAFAGASIGLLTYLASDVKQRDLTFWLLGSLGGSTWERWSVAIIPIGIALVVLPLMARSLDVFALGEREARELGIRTELVRLIAIVGVALGVGASVAVAGPVGFIGLVVPHLIRLVGGASHRVTIPASALLGAALLTASDSISRTIAKPAEVPVGVVTAFFGAPFFFALLLRRRGTE